MTWCWWCCHSCENEPLSLPYKYDSMRKKFYTCGIFCSWGCMKAYNTYSMPSHRRGVISGNIVIMRKQLFNLIGIMKTAPNRFSLKEFGGHLTIEEFRSGLVNDIGPLNQITHDNDIINDNSQNITRPAPVNTIKLDQIITSSGTNDSLRLKRSKPLKRNDNNLEKSLGITRKKTTQ